MLPRHPPIRVYIAGPYTGKDEIEVAANVTAAMEVWHDLADRGSIPYCPHLTHYLHQQHNREWVEWLIHDFNWLSQCQALLRIPGKSDGAEIECFLAVQWGIGVFENIEDLETCHVRGYVKTKKGK